jgi:hypothetical protein
MILTIDNFDGAGARNYTGQLDSERTPRLHRRLNRPSEFRASLIGEGAGFVVPLPNARVTFARQDGPKIFTGYLRVSPAYEYLGWGERGPAYRYELIAESDEMLLDRKTLPRRAAFANRSAGQVLKQLASDLGPPELDVSAVQDVDTLLFYSATPRKTWSEHAAEIAVRVRACYRTHDCALRFEPTGAVEHVLDEADPTFSPDQLKVASSNASANDVTILGRVEPRTYVKDYFIGDGFGLRYFLSETPFTRSNSVFADEEFRDATLRPEWWTQTDPASAISVSGGKLRIDGGTGSANQTLVSFVERLELGGALQLQHGDVSFSAASDGILGGLYNGVISAGNCIAGFLITPSGTESQITALINGATYGTPVSTVAGRRYVLATRTYARESYRRGQTFHSSLHPAGSGIGSALISSDIRIVLEVREVDPNNPASLVAPSTVLYDDVIANAPDYCSYSLVNATNMHCSFTFTRLMRAVDAEVRSALPSQPYRTRLLGAQVEGAECRVTAAGELWFFTANVPASNEKIVVRYRASGRSQARLMDNASVAAEARGQDTGKRGTVKRITVPEARTSEDCRNAALALLDEGTQTAWSGEYKTWSDFLPAGSTDIHPGDAVAVHAPSRGADFTAIVREVDLEVPDLNNDRCLYRIAFSNDAAESLSLVLESAGNFAAPDPVSATDSFSLPPSLSAAEVTIVSSTNVTVDTFADPPSGGGFEVRRSDAGWGMDNDRNLIGRFNTRVFALLRLSRVQTYYLRAYDASAPPRYSRDSVLLHVDYPL